MADTTTPDFRRWDNECRLVRLLADGPRPLRDFSGERVFLVRVEWFITPRLDWNALIRVARAFGVDALDRLCQVIREVLPSPQYLITDASAAAAPEAATPLEVAAVQRAHHALDVLTSVTMFAHAAQRVECTCRAVWPAAAGELGTTPRQYERTEAEWHAWFTELSHNAYAAQHAAYAIVKRLAKRADPADGHDDEAPDKAPRRGD